MDVVASQIASLGGRLSLSTEMGAGTTFTMQLPVPRLLVRCILLRAYGRIFALPADEIVTTTLVSNLSAKAVAQPLNGGYSWHIEEGQHRYPGLDLYEYWHPLKAARALPETAIGLKIQSLSGKVKQPVWLLADDLVEQIDLLIEHLPQPMVAPQGLMGVSLQADGQLIPVLDAGLLIERLYGLGAEHPLHAGLASNLSKSPANLMEPAELLVQWGDTISDRFDPESYALPVFSSTILVVDDAALVRRRIEASLTAAGYRVQTCADGLEAWQWLQNHPQPALMITDIEMPNMDGFTLVNRCRESGRAMPVLVSSSRVSPEWEREARRLGATEYLTKGFTTPQLLEKVQQLLMAETLV
jgi:chemosensory pili system protein ChpA (sensor histidine kinase/response regulator)